MKMNFEYYDSKLDEFEYLEDKYKISDEIKSNIISWYPFEKNSRILEIDSINDSITKKLLENGNNVVSICSSKEKAKTLQEKLSTYNNLEIIVGHYSKIKLNVKFDYITLIGTLDVYKKNIKAKDKLKELIEFASQYLKDDGKLLICIDNSFGMKYWTSIYADNNIICNKLNTIAREDLNYILEKNNFNKYKYYYPLPDYKYTNVIFTDSYLPNIDNISRNYTYPVTEYVSYNETEVYEKIIKYDKEKFKFFASSFFVEVGKNDFVDNDIRFVSYTNSRKSEYKIMTTIYNDKVTKVSTSDKSENHIKSIKNNINIMNENNLNTLDSYEDNVIISKYVKSAKSYDEILIKELKDNSWDVFVEKMNSYLDGLKNKFERIYPTENIFDKYSITYDKSIINELYFIKDGLWDLTFQNCFYIDNKLYFYDQEWYEENLPLEFLLYRNIIYFPEMERYIKQDKLFEIFGITKYVKLFEELDNKLQDNIRDDESWKEHLNIRTGQLLLDRYKNLINERDSLRNLNDVYVKDYSDLAQRYNNLAQEYSKITNSKFWQLVRPINKIKKKIKREKGNKK